MAMVAPQRLTITVTGGAGFIGSHVVEELLHQGHKVRVVDDLSAGCLANLPATFDGHFTQIDLSRGAAASSTLRGSDAVIHLAAMPNVQRSIDNPPRILANNMLATAHVLEAARRYGIRRVVLASSAGLYAADAPPPHTEDLPCVPANPYTVGKLHDEALARVYAQTFGVDTVALRFFNVYGPRQDPNSPYSGVISIFCRKLLARERPVIFGDGLQTRDFIYVKDVARACVSAACNNKPLQGRAINIGTGQATTLLYLLAALADAFGVSANPEHAPARLGEVRHSRADVGLAKTLLNFCATTRLRDGLAETVSWITAGMPQEVGA